MRRTIKRRNLLSIGDNKTTPKYSRQYLASLLVNLVKLSFILIATIYFQIYVVRSVLVIRLRSYACLSPRNKE